MGDPWTLILAALAVGAGAYCGALAACSVRAARRAPADTWWRRVDPDTLIPPPLTDRVAPPRARRPR